LANIIRNTCNKVDVQNYAAYAIQEILKEHGCTDEINSPKKSKNNQKSLIFWNSFSPDTKKLITPFLSSSYGPSGMDKSKGKKRSNSTSSNNSTLVSQSNKSK
jgi:hypothetical protein